jgi:hypothetical protein
VGTEGGMVRSRRELHNGEGRFGWSRGMQYMGRWGVGGGRIAGAGWSCE